MARTKLPPQNSKGGPAPRVADIAAAAAAAPTMVTRGGGNSSTIAKKHTIAKKSTTKKKNVPATGATVSYHSRSSMYKQRKIKLETDFTQVLLDLDVSPNNIKAILSG